MVVPPVEKEKEKKEDEQVVISRSGLGEVIGDRNEQTKLTSENVGGKTGTSKEVFDSEHVTKEIYHCQKADDNSE